MCSRSKIAAAILLTTAFASQPAPADVITTAACKLGGVKATINTSTADVISPSAAFKAIPGAAVNFTAGTSSKCVIAQFSGLFIAAGDDALHIRAVIDGSVVASPPEIVIETSPYNRTQTFYFVFPDIAAGAHQVRMQWHNSNSNNILVGPRTTIVEYTP